MLEKDPAFSCLGYTNGAVTKCFTADYIKLSIGVPTRFPCGGEHEHSRSYWIGV